MNFLQALLIRIFRMVLLVHRELADLYTLFYCMFVSVLSAYGVYTGDYSTFFDTLHTSTLYYMTLTIPRYIIEYIDYSYDLSAKVIKNEQELADYKKKSSSKGSKAFEYIVHHAAVISMFSHFPGSEYGLEFSKRTYTKIHLFEFSTIFMTIVASPLLKSLFVGVKGKCDESTRQAKDTILKLMFFFTFIPIRMLWLLPGLTYELYYYENYNDQQDMLWWFHMVIMCFGFWLIHLKWSTRLIQKFVENISQVMSLCRRKQKKSE